MSSYLYDDLLQAHFEKLSFLGMMARGAAKLAPTAGKFGLGYTTGIPIGGAGTAGAIANSAHGMAGSVSGPGAGPGLLKNNSLREKGAYELKIADDWKHHLGHVLPYLGFIGAHGLDAHGHKNLATAVNLASLGALGAQTGTKESPDALDLAGLGLMSGAELLRLRDRLSSQTT